MTPHRSLFLSHGAPDLVLGGDPTADFISGLGRTLARPRAVVLVSAHWTTAEARCGASARPGMIYDFSGFSPALHDITYGAPGDPALARELAAAIGGRAVERDYDHGVWVPLQLLWPDAGVPVIPLAVMPGRSAAEHWRLGEALAPFTADGVLVIGSGGATHNLGRLGHGTEAPPWVARFDDWLVERCCAGDGPALCDYLAQGPEARLNHPTPEHFLPLVVAMAAAGPSAVGRLLHRATAWRVLRLTAFGFA